MKRGSEVLNSCKKMYLFQFVHQMLKPTESLVSHVLGRSYKKLASLGVKRVKAEIHRAIDFSI